jgi:predicted membrane channel-forming protein YqfA (hemolysin III family)
MLSYRARRRWSLLILLVGLPLYIIVAVTLMNWIDSRWGRQAILLELAVYAVLGVLWVLPFRAVFKGIGQGDPAEKKTERP